MAMAPHDLTLFAAEACPRYIYIYQEHEEACSTITSYLESCDDGSAPDEPADVKCSSTGSAMIRSVLRSVKLLGVCH